MFRMMLSGFITYMPCQASSYRNRVDSYITLYPAVDGFFELVDGGALLQIGLESQ
jgi:hypothetical protein